MFFQLVKKSSNSKVGPIPITNSTRATCPPACPLSGDGGCYAENYHTRLNWDQVDKGARGKLWPEFLADIEALPAGTLWRHNVAGDLPPIAPDKLDESAISGLVSANRGKRGFTYTHYPMTSKNARIIQTANDGGFTINASANTEVQAVGYAKRGLPTVSIISKQDRGENWRGFKRAGVQFVQCPAEYKEGVTCQNCKLCAHPKRSTVVGFTVHGTRAKRADIIARG